MNQAIEFAANVLALTASRADVYVQSIDDTTCVVLVRTSEVLAMQRHYSDNGYVVRDMFSAEFGIYSQLRISLPAYNS